MNEILPLARMAELATAMDEKVLSHLREGQTETFEAFDQFDLIAFDWYDVRNPHGKNAQILLYLDQNNLFAFCESEEGLQKTTALMNQAKGEGEQDNYRLLYRFFVLLLTGDTEHIDQIEAKITHEESAILSGKDHNSMERISAWRRELLRLKHYYEQLDAIFEGLSANDNTLLPKADVRRMVILGNRTARYLNNVQTLRDMVTQLREAYQSQLSIQQNDLMKMFTLVTVIFLPLTLLVGWYGMNFSGMPELQWRYGYPTVILISAEIVAVMVRYFKKNKWL